ncbi:jg15745 [Pararge aegeria aegeria]|uniref:Jg15745 protein n=1 Tax=Pararge aegeria aegeria TaxID=348720 RepID=A0A8S4RJ28_9NEOP|nr:jg15745 [Pararge aegeria aegeria]
MLFMCGCGYCGCGYCGSQRIAAMTMICLCKYNIRNESTPLINHHIIITRVDSFQVKAGMHRMGAASFLCASNPLACGALCPAVGRHS